MSNKHALAHARRLILKGWENGDILACDACRVLDSDQLRSIRFQEKRKAEKKQRLALEKTTPTPEKTTETTPMQRDEKEAESPHSDVILWVFLKNAVCNFHPVDALYFLGVGICCNGVAKALHPVGWLVSVVVFGVAFIALQGLKTSQGLSRWKYTLAFAGVEIAAAICHIAWADETLWRNVERLPFDIYIAEFWSADAGKMKIIWAGSQTAWPFYTACGIAACFFLSGVFVYFVSIEKKLNQ